MTARRPSFRYHQPKTLIVPNSTDKWTLLSETLGWTVQRIHPGAGLAEFHDERGDSVLLTHEQRDDILDAISKAATPATQ